jgi:hypothetical protein
VHGSDGVVELADQRSRPADIQIAQDAHVHAGGERPAAPDEDRHARRAVGGKRVERLAHGVDEGGFEEVERWAIERAPDGVPRPLKRQRRRH